jgi:hypothetical protein
MMEVLHSFKTSIPQNSVTSQKMTFFIVTTTKTSNLPLFSEFFPDYIAWGAGIAVSIGMGCRHDGLTA